MRTVAVCVLLSLGLSVRAVAKPRAPVEAPSHPAVAGMMPSTDKPSPLSLITPLKEKFSVDSVSGSETLGVPFEYEITTHIADPAFKPDLLLRRSVTLRIRLESGAWSYVNGYVSEVAVSEQSSEGATCVLTLVPWVGLLRQTATFDIFQGLPVPEILKRVFKRYSFAQYETHLSRTYPTLETTTQYRETDLNFIDRGLEDAGIAYYFRHEKDRHVLVLADSVEGHPPFRKQAVLTYGTDKTAEGDETVLSNWQRTEKAVPTAYRLTDHNFQVPGQGSITVTASEPRPANTPDFLIHDYPGDFPDKTVGGWYARLRLDESRATAVTVTAMSAAPDLHAGTTFTLARHPVPNQNGAYLVTQAKLTLEVRRVEINGQMETRVVYKNQISAVPLDHPYRPSRNTSVPTINGPQTAIVVGPKANEVHTDALGRVQVRFFWDTRSADRQNAAWVRVAQPLSATSSPGIAVPRVGQEVVVDFIEGDADQPLVTGVVYNVDQARTPAWPRAASVPTTK